MKIGIAASKGYAIGTVVVKEESELNIEERVIENVEAEKERFKKALEASKEQLLNIKEKAAREMGADKAAVFESHAMLLEDPEFAGAV